MTDQELLQAIRSIVQEETAPLKEDIKTVKEGLHKTNLIIENQLDPAIDALAEGQDLTHQMMKGLTSKDETERLKDEIYILKTVVAAHSREIEALKKAQ